MAKLARQTMPVALRRWREGSPDESGEGAEGSDARHEAAADRIVETLGELKGLAMKAGQMMSYMDGALPESVRPAFQRSLRRLQSQAPPMSWEAVAPVLEEDLGEIDSHFAELEHAPIAAASIGQVHRGRLHDGTVVAVKVQYPGVRESISADMKNLDFMKSFAAPMMMMGGASENMNVMRSHLHELRDRLLEECDYEREAQMQQLFLDRLAEDEIIKVPRVFHEHSSARVLVSEYVEGRGLDEVCGPDTPQALRDRWAAALCKVISYGLYEWGLLHADPHPGNYLFLADGRICLLDFGCVKALPDEIRQTMRGYVSAAIVATRTGEGRDWAEFDRQLEAAFGFGEGSEEVAVFFREYLLYCLQPIVRPGVFHFDEAYTRATVDLMVEGKRDLVFPNGRRIPKVPKLPPMPADYLMVNRLQWGFFSILTQLDAHVDWHAQLPAAMRA
jgi:predicted unusual protein kinase regulating ubiquinone biosynthesis (AarF/ABC1/UbiB family)